MVKKPDNIFYSHGKIKESDRKSLLGHRGIVLWFTGISGSGKSTIAVELEKKLIEMKKLAFRLDGDNIRHGLNADLGFSEEDRNENIRRITEVAVLFKDAGVITIVTFISPFKKMREAARKKIGKNNFYEIYIKADINTCAVRDPKGLYKKAQNNEINNFTGISSPYEEPDKPDLVIDTIKFDINQATDKILNFVLKKI